MKNTARRVPLLATVAADYRRYGCGLTIVSFLKLYVCTPGFRYCLWMRVAGASRENGLAWRPLYYLSRAMLHHCGVKYGISIPYNTRIGPGLYIGHYGGIVVNDGVVIGSDCNINHEVTIGVKYGGKNPGVPIIGDRVYFGPGCKVIGGVRLGNDVAIGTNAVVVDSVPDSAVAVGVPAKVVSYRGSSEYVVNSQSNGCSS
jgi:serine O-acetyltransferase